MLWDLQAQFHYTTNNGTITITGYTGPGGLVIVPSTINGLPVTVIGDNSFSYCADLVGITIPNDVTRISAVRLLTRRRWQKRV